MENFSENERKELEKLLVRVRENITKDWELVKKVRKGIIEVQHENFS